MDSLVRFHGADENSASEMAHVSAAVQQIIRDFETSVVFADHVRKLAGTPGALDLSLRGSTEKAAFVDSLLSLRKERGHLVVEHSKSRWAQPAPAFEVAIEDGASAEGKTTVVRWVRTLDDLKDEGFADEDEETVPDHLREIDEWTLRTQIVASLRAEMNPKRIDDALARLVSSKLVERKDEKGPRGGKAASFRPTKGSTTGGSSSPSSQPPMPAGVPAASGNSKVVEAETLSASATSAPAFTPSSSSPSLGKTTSMPPAITAPSLTPRTAPGFGQPYSLTPEQRDRLVESLRQDKARMATNTQGDLFKPPGEDTPQ